MGTAATRATRAARVTLTPRRGSALRSQRSWFLLDYFLESQRPYASLLLLLPLLVLYEAGTALYASDPHHHTEVRIIAFNLLNDFFRLLGASGKYLPPLAVVGILLSWHIARNDPWRVRFTVLSGMAAESIFLGVPPLLLSLVARHHVPLAAAADCKSLLVLSLGAGIYEELVFRLIAFTLLNLLLLDLLSVGKNRAGAMIVLLPALLFSAYHYLGNEAFTWQSFIFRTGAGAYFGMIFLFRGFGITACAHAAYDIIIVVAAAMA